MLSGLGPKNHLQALNIPVLRDLSTGYNYHDHFVNLAVRAVIKFPEQNDPINFKEYCANRTGVLSDVGILKTMGFVNTNNDSQPPNLQIQSFLEAYDPAQGTYTLNYLILLVDPKSRGRITLNSTDPFDYPRIHARSLSDNADIRALIDSVRVVKKLLDTPTMRALDAQLTPTTAPACASHQFDTDAYWECVIRHQGFPSFHNVGSCKMGPAEDPHAVVDARLRVHGGVNGLRVVDASIMPRVVNRNTNAAVIMIGEKGADLIKQDHGVISPTKW